MRWGAILMTLYDVLRRLITLAPMGETERADATRAIDEAEQWAALGTVAGQLSVQAHQCVATFPNGIGQPAICGLCHKQLTEG
jgi:hypothetical protein